MFSELEIIRNDKNISGELPKIFGNPKTQF